MFTYILLGLSLAMPIGPTNIIIINNGIRNGFLAALMATIGVVLSDLSTLIIIFFGLSNFLNVPTFKTTILVFGILVLIYLGVINIKDFFSKKTLDNEKPHSKKNSLIEGYMTAISNPMAIVWWIGIFGPMITTTSRNQALFNGLIIIIGIFLWGIFLSILSHWSKRFLKKLYIKYMSLISGMILIVFGLKLAIESFF